MATKTIGTGGDYSTVQAWEDALLAVTTEAEVGQCKNEEFVVAGRVVDFSAHDTTLGGITLETVAGASFQDNASVRTNALRYNTANGAGLRSTSNETVLVSGAIGNLTVRKLQIKNDAAGSGGYGAECFKIAAVSGGGYTLKDLILEKPTSNSQVATIQSTGVATLVNILIIQQASGRDGISMTGTSHVLIGVQCVKPTNVTAGGTAFVRSYPGSPTLKDCTSFGFTAATSGSFGTSSNNATDLSSFGVGTSNQVSVPYSATTPFVNGTAASSAHDFRLAGNGNALIDNGVLDATNAPNDISGTARSSPPEIGVWEGPITPIAPIGYQLGYHR